MKYDLDDKGNSDDKAESESLINYSRPLIVLRKPRPSYTDDARSASISGTVKLKALFRATGEISGITVVNKLDDGLDRNAVDVVRKIKFLPAEIDGKPVDVFRTLEYSFTLY
jgi:TonB family protein